MVLGSPSEFSVFFGRETDLAALRRALDGHRLVTVTGAPGIGKTSLVQRYLQTTSEDWPQAWLCELVDTRDTDAFCAEVARGLGVGALPGGPTAISAVGRALAARGRALLVLDNLEQLLPDAAGVVLAWLAAAPEIHILVTSRETLCIDGEVVHDVAPLPEAAELFVERARRAQPGWTALPSDQRTIDEIVARLDRIPLAIELAAAQMRALSPAELLKQLPWTLRTGEVGGLHARHSTMRDAIAWSWHLLAPHEKRALAAASFFRGGFTLDAAEAVLGAGAALDEPPALDVLQALCDKSLLRAPQRSGRLAMFESIRELASATLVQRGEHEQVERAHARHYLGRADVLGTRGELERAVGSLIPDRGNYQAILETIATGDPTAGDHVAQALHAALVLDALSMADGLTYSEAKYLDAALERAGNVVPGLRGRAMVARAGWRVSRSHLEAALSDCLAALDLARRHDDPGLAAAAHVRTGFVMQTIGRMEEALVHAERSVQLHRRFGNEHGEAFALLQEASLLHSFGRREEAAERLRTSLALCRRIGFRMGEARCGIGAGFHAMENKDYAEARRWFDRVIELSAEIRAPRFTVISHAYRGLVELLVGRPAEATADFHVALAGAQELVNTLAQGRFLSFLAMAAAELDDRAGAERMAAEAEALLAPSPMWSAVLRLQHGCLDVAQARAARRAGDLEGERRCRQAARRRAEAARAPGPGGRSLLDRSDDARLGLRVLEQAYARLDALGDGIGAGRPELEAARDGGSFRIGLGTPIELSRRASLRGIFAALLARYESAPGAPLRNEELIEAGWPGERIPRKSALNRLRVALASLREMGLHGVIVRGDNGCLIRPEVRVTWSAEQDGTERAPPSGETGSALPPSSSGALE